MKLQYPIEIDILNFFKTGTFDCIEPGQTKEWIGHNFPDADGLSEQEVLKPREIDIWQYGDIEFHFERENLTMLYADYWDVLEGGKSLRLQHWMTNTSQAVNLMQMMTALNREGIDSHG